MKILLPLLLACLALPGHAAEPLLVAAASDLTYTMDELAAAFRQREPGAVVKVSLGASGNFFAQIKNGAPFDVYMSADLDYPARLVAEGAASAPITYAVGQLVLWTTDPAIDMKQGMRVLNDPRLRKVAIANPDVAPYGRAARAALQAHGYWDAVKDKLVIGENIAQTAQFVQTGNAQLGLVSYATVLAPRQKGIGTYYLVPDTGSAPIEQGAVITTRGKANPLAPKFMQFLRSPAARAIFLRHGFTLPRDKHA